jgi:hypothetical protein
VDAVHDFSKDESPQPRTPLQRDFASRMIGKSGQAGYLMPCARPMPGQLVRARGGRSHLRREILRYVKDLHDQ